VSYWSARLRNGLAKIAAGLTPFGESVWPGVRNDLFLAHASIYRFFASEAVSQRVLDAGCGAGYGAHELALSGARSVQAVDIDARNIRYARRHFAHPAITFAVADLAALTLPAGSLDLVVSSNVLEHLEDPARFLSIMGAALVAGGRALIAVPPITFPGAAEEHRRIHYHRSNLTVDQWLSLFSDHGWQVAIYAHRYPRDPAAPNFRSPHPSRLDPDGFAFMPADRDTVYADPPITAVFSLSRRAA
jgi:SAM-dependent methyltransferase